MLHLHIGDNAITALEMFDSSAGPWLVTVTDFHECKKDSQYATHKELAALVALFLASESWFEDSDPVRVSLLRQCQRLIDKLQVKVLP